MTLASNCMTAPGTGTSTTLTGTFGELLAPKKFTSGIEKTLREGRRENILGVELEAGKDSDLGISAVRLQFTHSGDGSNRLDQYFDEVSVLNGSTKVGSTNPGSFSRTGSISTGSITLSNVIVKKGEKLRLVVAGEVLNTIRSSSTASQDNISADWAVELTQVRYFDASGVFMTDGVTGVSDNLDFESSTAFDGLRVQSTGLNPISSNLKVKESSKSSEYEVFAFRLRGETDSSSVNVLEIPVNVAIFNPAAGVNNISSENVITDIWIKSSNGSLTFNDYDHTPITVANSATGNALYTFEIEEGDLRINSNTTLDLLVYVKFGSQNTKYDVGTTIQVSVDGSDLVVENIGGDGVNMSSAATITGNVHTTTLEAVNFTLKTPIVNVTSPQTGDNYITFIMPVEIDSDETLYILKDAGATDIGYTFSETGEAASFSTGVNQPNIVSAGGNDYFEVSGKKVIYFRVIFTGDSTNGSAVVVTLQLDTIEAATTAGGATTTYTLAPANAFDAEGILLI